MATSKAQVQSLQTALNRWAAWLDLSPLKVDGVAGKYTLAAVKKALASEMSNPDAVSYDFVTTPAILIGTDGLVANLADLFNKSADSRGMPAAKPIPASKTPTVALQPATVGRDQTLSAGMLGLGLPNWVVYSGGAAFALSVFMLIRSRKKNRQA